MLNRVAVFTATPVATFLALLLELFLGFGIGKTKEELDAVMFGEDRVEFLDDMLCDLTSLEPERIQNTATSLV